MDAELKNMPLVVTVGRQFGSGGRELGRALASALGINFYDRALLEQAASHSGLCRDFFERHDERQPGFLGGLQGFAQGYVPLHGGGSLLGHTGSDAVYCSLADFIGKLAGRESCVIVGRTADYVLRDHPRCANIFVKAPLEHCVARIMRRGDSVTAEKARALALRTNKLRAGYYNFFTDKRWGDAASYDLTLDSSQLPLESAVELIVSWLRLRGLID